MTAAELEAAWVDLHRLPPYLRERCLRDSPLLLLSGPSLQSLARYRGQTGEVPGRPGVRWSEVIGIAEPRATVVLANWNLSEQSASGVLLHEVGHQFDRSLNWISDGDEWLRIHRKAHWRRDYADRFPREGFADAFADYFYSPMSREALPDPVRAYLAEQLRACPEPPIRPASLSSVVCSMSRHPRKGDESFTPNAPYGAYKSMRNRFFQARLCANKPLATRGCPARSGPRKHSIRG